MGETLRVQIFKTWKASWIAPGQDRGALVLRALIYLLMLMSILILIISDKPGAFAEDIAALEAKGKKLELRHHVAKGLLYGSLINLALGAGLLWLRKFWGKRLPRVAEIPSSEGRLPGRLFWAGILMAVVLAGGLRMHLAKGSLWWDELWNVKQTMSGEFRPDMKKGGELRFREASWEQAFYYYRKPTNHPPMAVASRLSLGAWRKISGAERSEFNEVAVRLPSILAGLASVVLIGVLLRSWGFGAGGLVAAFILALHPWHVRYGIDARAYSLAVLWTILGCLWLGKVMRSGGNAWRYWLLFGLNQLLFVWSLPNGIYYAFAFGIAALVFCLTRLPGQRAVMFARLAAVNVVAAMLFIFLFLPNALQIPEWGPVHDFHYLSVFVLENVLTHLSFGMEIAWGDGADAEGLTSFQAALSAYPIIGWLAIGLGCMALLRGAMVLRRKAPHRAWLFLTVFCGAGLSLLVTWELHQHFYQRYVVAYMIVPVVALVGIGAVEMLNFRRAPQWLPLVGALLMVGVFARFTHDQRVVFNTRSYAPFRETAEFLGREAKVQPINVVGYGLGGKRFQVYYPESKFAGNLEELDAQLGAAKKRGGPVYVVCGYLALNKADGDPEDPQSVASGAVKASDPQLFDVVTSIPGIDPMFFFRVMRAK